MVVTTQKDFDEILQALGDRRAWVVAGCAECAAVCQTGGSAQVDEMVRRLEERGLEVLASVSLASPCDRRLDRRDLRRVERELRRAEGVLCLTCGGGVQAVAQTLAQTMGEGPGFAVVAGLDAHFVGTVERLGAFHEECALCGACLLNHTGGLCPVTLCPKGLRSGPCEGSRAGRCDASPQTECAWELIYARLEGQGRAAEYGASKPVPDWTRWGRPRSTARRGERP